jgi:hypothetical protein
MVHKVNDYRNIKCISNNIQTCLDVRLLQVLDLRSLFLIRPLGYLLILLTIPTYHLLNLALQRLHVRQRHHYIKYRINQPENVVNVIYVGQEVLFVQPEAYIVEVQWMVSEEVQNQRDVRYCTPKHHLLRCLLMRN